MSVKLFKGILAAVIISASGFSLMSCDHKNESKDEKSCNVDSTQIVLDNILTRTSIREFTSQPVSQDTLLSIVRAGMAAPSAVDLRPWNFIIITEKDVLQQLDSIHPFANLKTATAAIVVCGLPDKTDNEGVRKYWVQDCSAATENILLAAHAYGLGAVWCGVYPNEERVEPVKNILQIPENVIPLNIITMGYPNQNPQPKDKWDENNIHFQKF